MNVAAEEASGLAMGFDVTLGSGWPGGALIPVDAAEKQLLVSTTQATGPGIYNSPIPLPEPPEHRDICNGIMNVIGPFDEDVRLIAVTAARIVKDSQANMLDSFTDISACAENGHITWEVPEGEWKIFAFYQNHTSHSPVGSAYPGRWYDALIADHLDISGAQALIENYGDPLVAAFGSNTPDAIFVDSFEMVGELPWTPSFLQRFQELKGYDLTPYLPLLCLQNGESKYTQIFDLMYGGKMLPVYTASSDLGMRVREDYEEVRGTLFLENFVKPIVDWVHANDMQLRFQSHGGWADYLDAYQLVDIPESEGLFAGGVYDFLKLASSGAHVSGNRFVGSESFIRLSGNPLSVTLEDFYQLGGRAISAGINRIVYHGFPYTYVRQNGQGWYPLSGEAGTLRAGPIPFSSWISQNHPVWPELSEYNKYMSRLSYAITCGKHEAEVAWLFPEWEYSDNPMASGNESATSLSLKRAGLVYDRISRQNLTNARVEEGQLSIGAAYYEALLISDLEVSTPEMMKSIEELVDAGVPVVVLGDLPDKAPGFVDYEQRDANMRQIVARIQAKVVFVEDESKVGMQMKESGVQPALVPHDGSEFAFAPEHRKVSDADIFMLFNESNDDQSQLLEVHIPAKQVKVFDPQTGDMINQTTPDQSGKLSVEITVAAGRSVVLVVK